MTLEELRTLALEVADLIAEHAAHADQIAALERDLDAAKAERDAAAQQADQNMTALGLVTKERDDARAALDVALHDLDAATDQNGVLTDQVRDSQRALFIAQDELAKARARIAELEAGQQPAPTTSTRFGMNVSQGTSFTQATSENAATIVKRLVATYGGLPTSKIFYSGALPATFNANYEGLVPGKHVYTCFKSFTVAALNSYCASIPAGWTVTLIYFQEPDDEIWVDKTMTIADYTAKTKQVLDTVKASAAGKDGRARVGQCFMEFSLLSGRWSDSVVVPGIDCLTFDAYFNTSPPADPSIRIKAMHAVAKRLGIGAWAILEMGDRRANQPTFSDGAARAAFWAKVYDALKAEGAEAGVYFNAVGTTGDHRLLPGEAMSDPTIALIKSRTK